MFFRGPKAVAGILSFLLPGLGQLYASRVPMALVFFLPFAFCLFSAWPSVVFLLTLASAYEAYQSEFVEGPPQRRFWFASAGIVGFVFWSFSLSPLLVPLQGQLDVERAAERAARGVRQCRQSLERYPRGPQDCPSLRQALDPWGHGFRYFRETRGKGGFGLISPGPDGTFGGGDDFTFRFR